MSDAGPFGSDESGQNPFEGMPFLFGDLAGLLGGQGARGWDAARQLAVATATGGTSEPNVDPTARMQIEELGRLADLHVGRATGLRTSTTGSGVRVTATTRSEWARSTLDAWRPLFEELAGSLATDPAVDDAPDDDLTPGDPMAFLRPLMTAMGPMLLSMTAGAMVGHLARRCFGPYSLPIPRAGDEIGIVLANVDEFGEAWSLPSDDLRLWICLHEVARHTVLGLPHVRTRLEHHLHDYLGSFEPDPTALEHRLTEAAGTGDLAALQQVFNDPEAILGAVRSTHQRELLPHFESLVAVIVGYVDHIIDEVGRPLLGAYGPLTEALRRHRVEADPSDRFVERLFGLELSQHTFDRGDAFVAGVIERAGAEGLGRLWTDEHSLPTPAEVDAPGLWLARIDLPQD